MKTTLCIINQGETMIDFCDNTYQNFFFHEEVIVQPIEQVMKEWFNVVKKENTFKHQLVPQEEGLFIVDINNKKVFTNINSAHSIFLNNYRHQICSVNSKAKNLRYYLANNLVNFESNRGEKISSYDFFNDTFDKYAGKKLTKALDNELSVYCALLFDKKKLSDVWVLVPRNFTYQLTHYVKLEKMILDLEMHGIHLSKKERDEWFRYAKNNAYAFDINPLKELMATLDEKETLNTILSNQKNRVKTKTKL